MNLSDQILQNLLKELKTSQADSAKIKSELNSLHENVKGLSKVIRDGNGDMSILTKLALLDQKITTIEKWAEDEQDARVKIGDELKSLQNEFDDLKSKMLLMDKDVQEHNEILEQQQRVTMDSVNNELELEHQEKLSKTKKRSQSY